MKVSKGIVKEDVNLDVMSNEKILEKKPFERIKEMVILTE